MVRYADDLVCLADSKEACEAIDALFRRELAKLELKIHPLGTAGKCEICAPNQPVEFLGVELAPKGDGYAFQISEDQMQKKRARLRDMSNLNDLVVKRITITKFTRRLKAKIDGWLDAYAFCDNYQLFERKLLDWQRDVIRAVLVDGLGLPKEKLTRPVKQFLELEALPPSGKRSAKR